MKQKQNTNYTVLAVGIVILLAFLSSCSVNRYNQEAVNMKPSTLAKYYTQCTLADIRVTPRGYKHIFVSNNSDTLLRYYNVQLKKNACYYVWKTKTDK